MKFQYYQSEIATSTHQGFIYLDEFVELHKCGNEAELFDNIKKAEINGDMAKKAKLKSKLLHFTPSVIVSNKRRLDNVQEFTGVVVLDFDHLPDEEYSEAFKHYLYDNYRQIFLVYTSPSKLGVKAFIKIPKVESIEEYREYFYGIAHYMEQYNGFDIATQNAVLPLFQSYDEKLLYRDFDKTPKWKIKGFKVNDFSTSSPKPVRCEITVTDKHKEKVFKAITTMIDRISDNGHPQVRSAGLVAGGRISAGYVSRNEIEPYLHNLIATNGYLRKGIKGYQLTASQAISKGMEKPLYFE